MDSSNLFSDNTKIQEKLSDFEIVKNDILQSIKSFSLWHYLAINEIRRRYKRTVIGPFWTTLSVAIFITLMSVMLSIMWKTSLSDFLPYFCTGYIIWTTLSTILLEGCSTYITNAGYLKQLSIPYCIYAFLVPWRNFLVLCHHFITILLVMIYTRTGINFNILYIIPALFIIFIAGSSLALILGMICSRFRDVKQLIESCLPMVMFVTPIMWKPGQLGRKAVLFTKLNPVYHYVTIMREPLLGNIPSLYTWLFSIGCTLALAFVAFFLFSKKYRNLIFWL